MGEPTAPLADGAQGPEFGSSASVSMTMQMTAHAEMVLSQIQRMLRSLKEKRL